MSTYESYSATTRQLAAHLGHDDAARITKADVVAFKDARLAAGRSPKTVGDNDLAGLKSIFGRAARNGRLASNPAEGVSVLRAAPVRHPCGTRAAPVRLRSKSFTAAEASAILAHAIAHRPARNEAAKMTAAKRWVPWLCAYTGARVGEIAQLRKADLRAEGGLWVLTITPEAGTVKTKEARDVVLHEHLVEQGFPTFVAASRPGHLFIDGKGEDALRGAWRTLKNRLREFAREVVTDERVAPNHAWRHTFKTLGRKHGFDSHTLDAIQGHAPATDGDAYGEAPLEAMARDMQKLPRF